MNAIPKGKIRCGSTGEWKACVFICEHLVERPGYEGVPPHPGQKMYAKEGVHLAVFEELDEGDFLALCKVCGDACPSDEMPPAEKMIPVCLECLFGKTIAS
jgi:hypothetical protein